MIIRFPFSVFACAVFNRARGSQLYGLTNSTVVGRIVSMLGMALCAASFALPDGILAGETLLWTWATLLAWCTPAWDKYWAAATGNTVDMTAAAFAPVDWIMSIIWPAPKAGAQLRLWGLIAMSLRMTLIAPCFIGLAFISGHPEHVWLAGCFLLMGLPYYVAGLFTKTYAVEIAEFANGAIIGAVISQTAPLASMYL